MTTKTKVRVPQCVNCKVNNAQIKRVGNNRFLCSQCFCFEIEEDVYGLCVSKQLFSPHEKIAVAISGGKDSTALAHVMKTINERHDMKLQLYLLSIDEGIVGYRDFSIKTVETNSKDYSLPLTIVSYDELYGLTLDDVARQIKQKSTCTYCGVLRRHAFDFGAQRIGCTKVATGHNADDVAESVVMNLLRCDLPRLFRCHSAATGEEDSLPRVKPFHLIPQREIVLYAHYKKLVFFSKECPYAVGAFRGHARQFIKKIETLNNSCITDFIHSAEGFGQYRQTTHMKSDEPRKSVLRHCEKCGYMSSQQICMACALLNKLTIAKTSEKESNGDDESGNESEQEGVIIGK